MISVGCQLSCESLWRYGLLCFWRLALDSLFDHSWIMMTKRSCKITGMTAPLGTIDLFPTLGASRV